MTHPDPARPDPGSPDRGRPDPFLPTRHGGWLVRRREKIAEEIARNRRGEFTVPTWVLATALGVFVAGWIALVIFA